jgi:hypothetical protein
VRDARTVTVAPVDERRHAGAEVEEWVFAAWTADGRLGVLSGHRLLGRRAWYWAALARAGQPVLHVAEWDVTVRLDPMIVKAQSLWAEHVCDDPMRQWSVGNETYAAALERADEGLGRAYGTPTPIAFDLEWYATAEPEPIQDGYAQRGVVHGAIDVGGEPRTDVAEIPAARWHRWRAAGALDPVPLERARAHTGVRAAFAFPDGTVADVVLTPDGWRARDPGS